MTRKTIFIVLALLVVAALGAWYWVSSRGDMRTMPANSVGFTLTPDDHTIGDPKAPVVLIEYAALTCPVCAGFDQQVFPAFKTKYIDTGKVFYVYRLLPLDPADGKAQKIALCLPAAQYFPFVDLLYHRQDEWGPEQQNERGSVNEPKTDAGLIKLARVAGLSEDKARACMTDTAPDAAINKVASDGAARYKLEATPTLVINGQVEPAGAPSLEELQPMIDPMLAGK